MNQHNEVITQPYVHETQEVEETQLAVKQDDLVRSGSAFDVPVEQFKAALDRRGQNRAALIAWVRQNLVEGVDFGRIEIKGKMSKPSLWKPGAEKICGMLAVQVSFPTLNEYEKAAYSGIALESIILRCEIRDGLTGNLLAEGVGARSLAKDYGDINKALKMAEKSAHIDATLRLAGLSEVFTQDIEDMQKQESPDLTAKLEESIAWAEQKKREKEAAQSPAVKEMLEKARQNREAAQAELDRPVGVCEKCGSEVKIYTHKTKHYRFEQCSAARESQAVYAEQGHWYRRRPS